MNYIDAEAVVIRDPIIAATAQIAELRRLGATFIIAVTHQDFKESCHIAGLPGDICLSLSLVCWIAVGSLLVRCWFVVGALLVRCWFVVGALLVRCWCVVGSLLVRCWFVVGSLLIRCGC